MKEAPSDLALLGGKPAFSEPLHVGRPNIGDRRRLMTRLNELLDRHWLTNDGPLVQEFEFALNARLGARHVITVANGTLGLMLAAKALGVAGEVILPSFTFVATAHALSWQGLTPVFCDIDPKTYQIDPAEAERLITPRTSALLGVHLFGRPCDVDALSSLARRHRLKLLVDAAQAFGCSSGGRSVAQQGDAVVFSFHATKVVNSFEGGGIATDDDTLADALRQARNFGFRDYDRVDSIGINAKMSEPSAAMGLTSLEQYDEFVAINRRNHDAYQRALGGIPGLSLLAQPEGESGNHHYVILIIDESASGISRDLLMAVLHAENVLARRYFFPGCHRMEPYATRSQVRLPCTEAAAARILALPTGTAIDLADIDTIGNIIRLAAASGRELSTRPLGQPDTSVT